MPAVLLLLVFVGFGELGFLVGFGEVGGLIGFGGAVSGEEGDWVAVDFALRSSVNASRILLTPLLGTAGWLEVD